MTGKFLIVWCLMALCVAIHAGGLVVALRWVKRRHVAVGKHPWLATWLLIRLAGWVIVLHALQIVVWAAFFYGSGALSNFELALYFSAVTYTTTGYGDVVLPIDWRLYGSVEALTGILMCGLSTGMFFASFTKIFGLRAHDETSTNSS